MSSEMEMSADEYVTQTPFHLEPMRRAHVGKVQCCMNRATAICAREKCAFCVRIGRCGVYM